MILNEEEVQKHPDLPKTAGFDFAMRLATRLGVRVNLVDKYQMSQFGDENAKGLVFNGEIFLNLDNVNSNTLLHELTHVILGYLKESNYDDYNKLIKQVENDDALMKTINDKYSELTYTDKLEEAFAEKVANSMETKLSDPELDAALTDAGIIDAITKLFEIENLNTENIRDLMKSSLDSIITENPELYKKYGPVF